MAMKQIWDFLERENEVVVRGEFLRRAVREVILPGEDAQSAHYGIAPGPNEYVTIVTTKDPEGFRKRLVATYRHCS